MDTQIRQISQPHYKKIYTDILERKYPSKKNDCKALLNKKKLSVWDIIELNRKIFGMSNKETEYFNQKHRAYTEQDILEILHYQKKHQLNNSQLANHFKISRNTVAKWRKLKI